MALSRQTIHAIGHERVTELKLRADAFIFREDRKHHWLQRLCLGVLRKLGCQDMTESVTVRRYDIDAREFIDKLFEQRKTVIGFFNREPKELLIGAEDYAELMRETRPEHVLQFSAEYGYGRHIHGLTVRIIPWMRGILVLP